MNFRLLIRDPERDIKGQHADGWVIKYTYDDEHPDHHTRLINAKRGEHIDRRAIILYGKRIRTPIEHDKIAQSMGPGEWVIDENDPSTWDNQYREKYRMEGFLKSVARLKVDSLKMTTEQKQAVVALLRSWSIQPPEFWNLFTHPGEWRHIDNWEHKLRQVRNDIEIKLWGEA